METAVNGYDCDLIAGKPGICLGGIEENRENLYRDTRSGADI